MIISHIITHSGQFHLDELMASAILLTIYPEAKITRTRDSKTIQNRSDTTIVIDVGEKYEPGTLNFDHHQRGGSGIRSTGIPYASAGMIWKFYGERCIETIFQEYNPRLHSTLDREYIQGIDASDNGYTPNPHIAEDIKTLELGKIIHEFYPTFLENDKAEDEIFLETLKFCQNLLIRWIKTSYAKLEGETLIQKYIQEDRDNPTILFLTKPIPWKEAVAKHPEILYVIFPANKQWYCQCVPIEPKSFACRQPLPESWGGRSSEDLAKITGVKDATFAHKNLFICGAQSHQGIAKLARIAAGD